MNKKSLVGGLYGVVSSLVLLITFLHAYIQPSKTTIIAINQYGEANQELLLVVAGFVFSVYHVRSWIDERA